MWERSLKWGKVGNMRHRTIFVCTMCACNGTGLAGFNTGIVQAASNAGCGHWIVVQNPKLTCDRCEFLWPDGNRDQ